MSDERPESLIPYDEIVQEALRDVVGRVLVRSSGPAALPGDHHFYITFKTRMPGVSIPKHLSERFPDEMTIVIQHRFWDLKVEEDGFTVGLCFGGVPSTLHVPFAAVTDFVDPASTSASSSRRTAPRSRHEEHEEAENDTPQAPSRARMARTSSTSTSPGRSSAESSSPGLNPASACLPMRPN